MPNSNGQTADILQYSVTQGDVIAGAAGSAPLFLFFSSLFGYGQIGQLSPEPPAYWSMNRDAMFRASLLYEGFWNSAIRISCSKLVTQNFDVKGDHPQLNRRAREMLLEWGGRGYVSTLNRAGMDYLTTGNGCHFEVVRASSAAGSRVLGAVQLDSLRCLRTSDPERPIVYLDLRGHWHELKHHQVFSFSDCEDPGAGWFGVGHCAAEGAYNSIYELAATQRYMREKVTGTGADKLVWIFGLTTEQIKNLLVTTEMQAQAKGLVHYMGSALAGIQGDVKPDMLEVQLKGLPDNYNRKEQLDIALLNYSDSIGLDPQELQPLSGQGLGTGTQSRVLAEKAKGRWPARFGKDLIHNINQWLIPDKVQFYFTERDLGDETKRAEVSAARATTRQIQITDGEITAAEARQLAVDSDDLPKEFLPVDATPDESLSDEENPTPTEDVKPESTVETPPVPVVATKSVNGFAQDYEVEFTTLLTSFINGNKTAGSAGSGLRALIRREAEGMYVEGMLSSGVFESEAEARAEMDEADEAAIEGWKDEQLDALTGLLDALTASAKLSGDEKLQAQGALLDRAELWVDSFRGLAAKGKMSALANEVGVWDLGKTEKHCSADGGTYGCAQLDGTAHRLKWYSERGLTPRTPGSNTTCGGWECDCSIKSRKTGKVLIP